MADEDEDFPEGEQIPTAIELDGRLVVFVQLFPTDFICTMLATIDEAVFGKELGWNHSTFKKELSKAKGRGWCAMIDDIFIGHVIYRHNIPERRVEITNIAVLGCYQRNGIGRALLDLVLKRTGGDGATKFKLYVSSSNEPAQLLYKSFGFKQTSVLTSYYRKEEDALVMEAEREALPPPVSDGDSGSDSDDSLVVYNI